MYIADYSNHVVRKVTTATGIITTIAGTGFGVYNSDNVLATNAGLVGPSGIAVDEVGRRIYITFHDFLFHLYFSVF